MNRKFGIRYVMRRHFALGVAALLALSFGFALNGYAQVVAGLCGPLDTAAQYGPYDYRTATEEQKRLVEGAHFTPPIEALQHGRRESKLPTGDIDYTLRVFPNHPRALHAMTRWSKRVGMNHPPGATYTVECYYERAIRFAPDDTAIRALYAHFLIDRNRLAEAREQLEAAESMSIKDPQVSYNLGLAYFELKDYDRALKYAQSAYRAGVRFPALKEKLRQAGKWHEPQ